MSDEGDGCQLLAELVGDDDGGQLSTLLDTETRLQRDVITEHFEHGKREARIRKTKSSWAWAYEGWVESLT